MIQTTNVSDPGFPLDEFVQRRHHRGIVLGVVTHNVDDLVRDLKCRQALVHLRGQVRAGVR